MKNLFRILLASLFIGIGAAAEVKPSAYDLVGNWNGLIQVQKMKIRIVLRILKSTDGKVTATMDIVDQGVKGLPVGGVLYNHPDVRLEFDQLGANFNGTLNPEKNELKGAIDEGPGGKPTAIVFTRAVESSEPKSPKLYTFKPGEGKDIRGYWKTTIEPMPGINLRLGLVIGRASDGSYEAFMDSLDQGAKEIPASSVAYTNGAAKIEWQGLAATLEGKLEEGGNKLSGTWKQGPKTIPVTFDRLDKPAKALADNLSFDPGKDLQADIRGRWEGALEIPDHKLRLVVNVGQAPDGAYGGSMVSLDQGGVEIPSNHISLTNSSVRMEWKTLRAIYTGTLTNQGQVIEGKFEQMGTPLPLRFERKAAQEQKKL